MVSGVGKVGHFLSYSFVSFLKKRALFWTNPARHIIQHPADFMWFPVAFVVLVCFQKSTPCRVKIFSDKMDRKTDE